MRRINLDHLARVEGNGSISVVIEGNVVKEVHFIVNEGPRLIEQLAIGRTPEEDVSIVPRVCAICSISHRNSAIRAMENALEIKVSRKVRLLRELMHLGEIIESQSLHVFLLALPDFLGFPNALAMVPRFEFELSTGLEIKSLGNRIMEICSGRYIHGENPVIGGFGKFPEREDLLSIKIKTGELLPALIKTVQFICELDYPNIPEETTLYACCLPDTDDYGFWGEYIQLSTQEKIYREDYKILTNEFIMSYSYAKRCRYQGKPYSVGALARINILGERLKGEAGQLLSRYYNVRWQKNPFFNNAAQAIEILYCFEKISELIDEILAIPQEPSLLKYAIKDCKGPGLVEAPRGLLIHHYEIKDVLVSDADIITPTAQNAEDIERYCLIAAQSLLDQGQEDAIQRRLDMLVRAYDPCISCSVH